MANETKAQIRAEIRRDLRDPINTTTNNGITWSNSELDDLINSGIDAISDLSPIETTEDNVYVFPNYSGQNIGVPLEIVPTTDFKNIFRVDILDTAGRYYETLPIYNDSRWGNGWQWFGGKVILPSGYSYPVEKFTQSGNEYERVNVRIWGYKRHEQLTTDGASSDLTTAEKNAVKIYVQAEALSRLMIDRADFQQWQIASGATNMTISELSVLASSARTRWRMEMQRLRKFRQIG